MKRRELLKATPIFLASGLSGCGVIPGMGGGGNGGMISGGEAKGRSYVVTLSDGSGIDKVNLLNPTGEKVVTEEISDDQSQVRFILAKTGKTNLGKGVTSAYRIGEYTIQAVGSDGSKQELPVTFTPELSISDVSFLDNIDQAPSLDDPLSMMATFNFKFRNTGNAPAIVDDVSVEGSRVPNPLPVSEERNYRGSGAPYGVAMYRFTEQSSIPRQSIAVPAGQSTWYRLAAYPAAIPIAGIPNITKQTMSEDGDSTDQVRPAYSNTSAVRTDYVKPPIEAKADFSTGNNGVSVDFSFSLSGEIDTASANGTNYFYFLDHRVTEVDGSRRGL